MRDPRVEKLARVIVRYSLELKEGHTFLISSGAVAEPLVQALYEQALEAGAHPVLDLSLEGTQSAFFRLANDEQLDWVSPTQQWAFEHADARLRVLSDTNTRELSGVPPEKQTRRQKAMHPYMTKMMERSAAGDLRWNVTLFPTNAYAHIRVKVARGLTSSSSYKFISSKASANLDRTAREGGRRQIWCSGYQQKAEIRP